MSDKLKHYIEDNQGDFEVYPFDAEVGWAEISDKVRPAKKWPVWKSISVAACLVLMATGVAVQFGGSQTGELTEIESYYESEISYKTSLVKSQIGDPGVLQDLEAMDQAFSELKADLKENVDNEEVILAMMENYQLKLQILEEILGELEKEKGESSL